MNDVHEAFARLKEMYADRSDIVGFAITGDGLRVYVSRPDAATNIVKSMNGFPVYVLVTGPIKAR